MKSGADANTIDGKAEMRTPGSPVYEPRRVRPRKCGKERGPPRICGACGGSGPGTASRARDTEPPELGRDELGPL